MQFCDEVRLSRGNDSLEGPRSNACSSATVAPTSIRTGTVHLIADPVAVYQELRRVFSYFVIFPRAGVWSPPFDAPHAQEIPLPGRGFPLANLPAARLGCHSFCPHRLARFCEGK